jgi:hypothetical protein
MVLCSPRPRGRATHHHGQERRAHHLTCGGVQQETRQEASSASGMQPVIKDHGRRTDTIFSTGVRATNATSQIPTSSPSASSPQSPEVQIQGEPRAGSGAGFFMESVREGISGSFRRNRAALHEGLDSPRRPAPKVRARSSQACRRVEDLTDFLSRLRTCPDRALPASLVLRCAQTHVFPTHTLIHSLLSKSNASTGSSFTTSHSHPGPSSPTSASKLALPSTRAASACARGVDVERRSSGIRGAQNHKAHPPRSREPARPRHRAGFRPLQRDRIPEPVGGPSPDALEAKSLLSIRVKGPVCQIDAPAERDQPLRS